MAIQLQLLAAVLLALGLVGFFVLRSERGKSALRWLARHERLTRIAEATAMLVATAVAVVWPMFVPFPLGVQGSRLFGLGASFELQPVMMYMGPPSGVAYLMLAILIICFYVFRSRSLFLISAVVAPILILYFLLWWKFFPVLSEIQAEGRGSEFWNVIQPKIMVSVLLSGIRDYATGIGTVLGALCFSRGVRKPWRYFLGAFLGALGVGYLTRPFFFMGVSGLLLQSLLWAMVARLLLVFPNSRRQLEFVSGLRLSVSIEDQPFTRAATLFDRLVSLVGLGLLGILILASAVINWSESESFRMISVEWRPTYRSHAALNAYSDLSRMFMKVSSPQWGYGLPSDQADRVREVAISGDDIRDDEYWSKLNTKQIYDDIDQFALFTSAYRAGAEKDYFEEPEPGIRSLSYLNVRECSRAIMTHALLCMKDGRTTESLEDIRTIIRFGALLKDYPNLVGQMIGSSIRGIGVHTAYSYYVGYRNDPDKMRALSKLLDEMSSQMRTTLNVEALGRGEPFTLPVVVMTEILIPRIVWAENTNLIWLNFEALRVATALEIYRADHGSYPALLDELVPNYLRVLPVDPFKGLSMTYSLKDGEFALDSPSKPTQPAYEIFVFPPQSLDELKKAKNSKP